jgi:Flp pilus assembly protein TadG
MVTAETAVVLPVLLIVLAAALWVLACVAGELRCVDAARQGARAAARGDSPAAVTAQAARIAPAGAQVQVVRTSGEVAVVVRAVIRPFGRALSALPGTPVGARATALPEGDP